jgi:hypothetical protein
LTRHGGVAVQIKMDNGLMLYQVRNRQDAKFEFMMPKEARARTLAQSSSLPHFASR